MNSIIQFEQKIDIEIVQSWKRLCNKVSHICECFTEWAVIFGEKIAEFSPFPTLTRKLIALVIIAIGIAISFHLYGCHYWHFLIACGILDLGLIFIWNCETISEAIDPDSELYSDYLGVNYCIALVLQNEEIWIGGGILLSLVGLVWSGHFLLG
jgi:hypothetical protein